MRRGFRDSWRYDQFPANAEIASIDGREIPVEDLPGTFVEREYDRRFPTADDNFDNEVSLARFRKVAGIAHKESKVVDRAPAMTRREETYARLAEKVKGNKWFDENA